MVQKSYRSLLLILALTGVVLDQATKYGIFAWLSPTSTRFDVSRGNCEAEIIPGAFRFFTQYHRMAPDGTESFAASGDWVARVNHGALFGFGNTHKGLANTIFAIISVVAGVAIVGWSFRRATASDRLLCLALGLILAGTIGNLYDRVIFGGVRDFLYWYYKFDWPVFNIADCCLVCGAFTLLAHAFLTHPKHVTEGAAADPAAAPTPAIAS